MSDISGLFSPASLAKRPPKPPDHTPTTTLKIVVNSGAVVRRTAGFGAGNILWERR